MLDFLKSFRPIAGDFLSTIFFIAVYEITKSIVIATGVGIGVGVVQFLWLKARRQQIALMQWASLALVIVLGTATIFTADPRFVMIKPSIGGYAIATVMLQRGWQLRYMPPIVKENAGEAFLVGWGYAWSALYYLLATGNLFISYRYGMQVWAFYNGVIQTAAPISLFVIQYMTMRYVVRRNVLAKMQAAANAAPAE